MKKFALLLCVTCVLGCSPFSPLADATEFGEEAMFVSVSNTKTDIKSLTFGDFDFARNRKELNKIGGGAKGFRDMLVYAKTTLPTYEYCIMYEPGSLKMDNPEFTFIDTLLNEKRVILAISKSAPARDMAFIKNNLVRLEDLPDAEGY